MALGDQKYLKLIDNYIYIYHLGEEGEFVVLPSYPDRIQDAQAPNFQSSNPIARSAPIFSYSGSRERTVQITLPLHREMLTNVNTNVSNLRIDDLSNDDYVDTLIKRLQACAVPNYTNESSKEIRPPMVAVRIGESVFIKGIISSAIATTFEKPILQDNKYAMVTISFSVAEVDPYDAASIEKAGSFRGITRTLKSGIYRE